MCLPVAVGTQDDTLIHFFEYPFFRTTTPHVAHMKLFVIIRMVELQAATFVLSTYCAAQRLFEFVVPLDVACRVASGTVNILLLVLLVMFLRVRSLLFWCIHASI